MKDILQFLRSAGFSDRAPEKSNFGMIYKFSGDPSCIPPTCVLNQHKPVWGVPWVVMGVATNSSQLDSMTSYCAAHTRSRHMHEPQLLVACNHVTRAPTGATNYLNMHSRHLHSAVCLHVVGVYGTCDDSRSRMHTHCQQRNPHCIIAEQHDRGSRA